MIGLIAGGGDLPKEIIKHYNGDVCLVHFGGSFPDVTKELKTSIGLVDDIINFFKRNGVNKIILAGKIKRPNFREIRVDISGGKLLKRILIQKIKGDDSILKVIADFLSENDLEVFWPEDINLHISNECDVLERDLEFAKDLITQISRFDVGQSVIIENGRVIAIEAAEGTDNMISRSKDFIGKDAFLVKMAKKGQSLLFDLPSIGIETLNCMVAAGIYKIAISKDVIIINKGDFLEEVKKLKITLKFI